MSAKSLSDVVYKHVFPGGMIPLDCRNNIPAIDKRIEEIAILASGKPLAAISARVRSQAITQQIVALKEGGMGLSEIAEQMGMTRDACRNRYEDYKAKKKAAALNAEGYAALSGQVFPHAVQWVVESSDHPVEPNKLTDATLRNDAAPKTDNSDQVPGPTKMIPNACDEVGNPICLGVSDGHLAESSEKVIASEPVRTGPEAGAEKLPTELPTPSPTIRQSQIVEESVKVDLQEAKPEQIESPPATIREIRTVEPEPEQAPATEPAAPDLSEENVLRLFHGGKSIKEIAKLLNVRVPWVRRICDADRKVEAEKVAPKKTQPIKSALSEVNSLILEMANKNALPSEICIAVDRRFHESFTTSEMVKRIANLRSQRA